MLIFHARICSVQAFTTVNSKGDKTDPRNYRPVSLTSLVCKTLEHILVSQIMKHLESNNILTDVQYGFRSKRSCEAQLFLAVNFARAVDNKVNKINCERN